MTRPVYDDAHGNRPITEKPHVATGIIRAIAGDINGVTFGLERRYGDLDGCKVEGAAD